jgi:hypothetical protein
MKLIYVTVLIGLALLFIDRYYRILPFLESEEFLSFSGGLQRCGVDLEPCPHGLKCMNGLCRSLDQPELVDRNPLPVLPAFHIP